MRADPSPVQKRFSFSIPAACLVAFAFACATTHCIEAAPDTVFDKALSDSARVSVTKEGGNFALGPGDHGKDNNSTVYSIVLKRDGRPDRILRAQRIMISTAPAGEEDAIRAFDATASISGWAFIVYSFRNKVIVDTFWLDGDGEVWTFNIGRMPAGATVVKQPEFLLYEKDLRVAFDIQERDIQKTEWHFLVNSAGFPSWEKLPGKNDPPQAAKDKFMDAMSNPDDFETLKSLLNSGVPVDMKDEAGRTAAMEMARMGALDQLKFLVGKGANLAAVDNSGNDALFWAISGRQAAVIDYLLAFSANVNAVNDDGSTELERAITRTGDPAIVGTLISRGARIDIRDNQGENAALYAALANRNAILAMLVKIGADPNVKDMFGRSAFHPTLQQPKVKATPRPPRQPAPGNPPSTIAADSKDKITIPANSPDGYVLGQIHKGTKITLQYSGGLWKCWGTMATENPDSPESEHGNDACRLVISLPGKDGVCGEAVAVIPPGTAANPFVFEAQQDYEKLVLRINGEEMNKNGSFETYPGSVQYILHVVPAGQ